MLPLLLPLLLGARALGAPQGDTAVVTPLRLDPDINGRPHFERGGSAEAVVFQLSAFGEDFYLHLAPDARFIAPAFAAQYLGTAPGAARPRPGLRHCFYSGDVNGDRESFAALSLCGGLRGAFGYRGAEYTISPLPGGAAGGAHRLQRRGAGLPLGASASRCAVGSGLTPGVLQALAKYRGRAGGAPGGRAKRFASVPRYVETLVVADESMVKFHGDDLQHYLLTLMATAARLYKHPSIRNPIQISVVKFLLIGQDDKGPKVTGNAALTLRNFCAWQKKWNKVSDKHPEYWDTAILFTKQVGAGPQGGGDDPAGLPPLSPRSPAPCCPSPPTSSASPAPCVSTPSSTALSQGALHPRCPAWMAKGGGGEGSRGVEPA